MKTSYHKELEMAIQAARAAGDILRADFHREKGARGSSGHAPADDSAEEVIRRMLRELHRPWGYRGEETGTHESEDPEGHVWLVDPNDGTSAYLEGYRGSAVSIGLLREGKPVLGVVYAPLAPDDRGDLFAWAEGCGLLRRNGIEVEAPPFPDKPGPGDMVFISQKADYKSETNARLVSPARFIAVPGIAYRLALCAAGEGVAALSLNSPQDWDYCGGHALLIGAGGVFINRDGTAVTYSRSGSSHSHWCFGGAPGVVEELRKRDWGTVFNRGESEKSDYDLVFPRKKVKIKDPGVLDRGQGCLLGQLAGDALGSLVEFLDPAAIEKKYPRDVRELHDGGTFNTIAGQPTDDSEMALILARSILKTGRYDPDEAARGYAFWYDSHPFDMGGTTSRALSAIAGSRGKNLFSIASKAASQESQANGSLMRISPLGIRGYALTPDILAGFARQDSSITHPHQVCRDACAVFTIAIARAIAEGKGAEDAYRHALQFADGSACYQVEKVIRDAAVKPPASYTTQMGWVLIALQNAFYQVLYAKSPEEGIVDTIMKGGDTDTNAAIAGALLGAVHGRSALPSRWRQKILSCRPIAGLKGVFRPRPRPFWPVDALELAEQLLASGDIH